MVNKLVLESFVGVLHGPYFPDSLNDLREVLERHQLKEKDFTDAGAETLSFLLYRGQIPGFTTPDGHRWSRGLMFRNWIGNKVYGEMLVLIPKTKRRWVFSRRLERSPAVYAWGSSEEKINETIREYVSSIKKLHG